MRELDEVRLTQEAMKLFLKILIAEPTSEYDERILGWQKNLVTLKDLKECIKSGAYGTLKSFAAKNNIQKFTQETILELFALDFHIEQVEEIISSAAHRKLLKAQGYDISGLEAEYFFLHVVNPFKVTKIHTSRVDAIYKNNGLEICVEGLVVPKGLRLDKEDVVACHFSMVIDKLKEDIAHYLLREQFLNPILSRYYQALSSKYSQNPLNYNNFFNLTSWTKDILKRLGL